MISKYLQTQIFYFILIFIIPNIINVIVPISNMKKGHIAAVMSIISALLWFFFGRKMI